ncbi:MAG: hypothetical protein HOP30_13665 [Cyclobacteriaceae bacterium]|nr:hypothetical protein [Cyclobacteriaceae bacterium]
MIQFSVDDIIIHVYQREHPAQLSHYSQHARFIDDRDLNKDGEAVYVIVSKGLSTPKYFIVAFRTSPLGYAGFSPCIHYEYESQSLFIGAGNIIKIYRLSDHQLIFEDKCAVGIWGWQKYKNVIIAQEETALRVFDLQGKQLWEMYVTPPYDFTIEGELIHVTFEDVFETRNLLTGKL